MINTDYRSITNIKDVDWASIWQKRMELVTFSGRGEDFWDQWAKSLPEKHFNSGYVEEVLKRMKLDANYTLLDVGSGTGVMALPLARMLKQVTALDNSSAMLDLIARKAARENISNIKLLKQDWAKASIGKDLVQHDIVLVSRSLPGGNDIRRSLQLINQAARRLCYVTWKVNNINRLEAELCTLLGIQYFPLPEFTLLYNILCSMDISTNVELFKTTGEHYYRSIEEAFVQTVRSHPVNDENTKKTITEFLISKLKYKDGRYSYPGDKIWALFWWEKNF